MASAERVLDKFLARLDAEADRLGMTPELDDKDAQRLARYAEVTAGIYRAEMGILSKLDPTKYANKQLSRLERLMSSEANDDDADENS